MVPLEIKHRTVRRAIRYGTTIFSDTSHGSAAEYLLSSKSLDIDNINPQTCQPPGGGETQLNLPH